MKKFLNLVTLIFVLILAHCQPTHQASNARLINQEINRNLIKNSTLLIVVKSIQSDGVFLAYGMGTLVQDQGVIFLVTHNHYGALLQDMSVVELRDAQNKLIRQLYGCEFKSLIGYQDPGTLVLIAPADLANALVPGSIYHSPQLKPGTIVQVAHREKPSLEKVEVIDAVVVDINRSKTKPVYELRRLNGQPLLQGDSGGGVWYQGKLVANTWSILADAKVVDSFGTIDLANKTLTDLSYAAIIPEEFP